MRSKVLEHISSPHDVHALPAEDLPKLCAELRDAILANASAIGGHLAPNLGVIELTVALHRVFDSPHDKIVFDVSHQCYAHKALTGRAAAYLDPEAFGTVSGFLSPRESEHDLFSIGHTSTSVSLACGLAKARDLAGEHYDVVAVIGDGSLSGGLAFEGLDNAAVLGSGIIIVVNDNDQSIAENHGGIYGTLAELRATHGAAESNIFRALGFGYTYVEAGNDVQALVDALESLRGTDRPVVLHIHTKKGAGYAPAERAPELWHHVGAFDLATGEKRKLIGGDVPSGSYADLTATHLLARMELDRSIVAITAGMPYVLGFTPERRAQAGSQFVDVGIAEEHAVTFSAALAASGAKPVFGVYGAFLQRAYDELWHDLCLNRAPATIVDIGASVFGANAETHLNFFDLAMLSGLPNLRVLAPTCLEEYLAILDWSLDQQDMPVVIRMPVGSPVSRPELAPADHATFGMPSYQVVREGADVAILALGGFFSLGEQVAEALAPHGVQATLVNPRFATELDEDFLSTLPERHRVVVTLEDGVLEGGWGEKVARFLATTDVRTRCYGIPRNFYDRFDPQELLASCGITVEGIANDTLKLLRA
ncbi:1-deoxy-D-xylulose-5-phosphate synthase [uncultured Enorma sp.]|uniref:1-deoxy-D-xylulose-5-phosphate synthase n=1 Tax=uncultured Enorma sp. TaxID=1714346 RepID=UPI00262D08AE|nr:1-deoxy-D-xylulose-5-phosphate synthase [uncultured Enorma sp.]